MSFISYLQTEDGMRGLRDTISVAVFVFILDELVILRIKLSEETLSILLKEDFITTNKLSPWLPFDFK